MTNAMAQGMSYGWIELAALLAGGKMVRGHYVRSKDLDAVAGWRRRFNNTDVFSSVAFYAEPNNSAASIVPMFFDIDGRDNLAGTQESVITLCELLKDRVRVTQDNLDIFFSGNKGFHVVIAPQVFRAFDSPNALRLYRRMAQKAGAEGVRFVDESVYTHKRLWRLSNSRHGKSGLFKIPLAYEELRDIKIDGIRELAANPRPEDSLARQQVCKEAAEWYRRAIAVVAGLKVHSGRTAANTKFKQGWRMPPCTKAIQDAVLPDGVRHQTYLALARFYRWIGMHPEEIRERIGTLDNRNPVRDPDYIERTVEWACEHPGFAGCDDESLRRYCRSEDCFYAKLKNARTGDTRIGMERSGPSQLWKPTRESMIPKD